MAQRSHEMGRWATGWAVGLALFAGALMLMTGAFQIIAGIAAILEDDVYAVVNNYAFKVDLTAWGWIHVALGVLVGVAGFFVFTGKAWARAVGITVAALVAIANFLFLPYYPFWSILIIALNVAVIWALAVYGRREAEKTGLSV